MTRSTHRRLTDVAASVVRLWTRTYTWRMDHDLRSMRLGEIESDLWEARHDTPPLSAWHLLARLISGIPADLGWRCHRRRRPHPARAADGQA